jgi:hypothetical protein
MRSAGPPPADASRAHIDGILFEDRLALLRERYEA